MTRDNQTAARRPDWRARLAAYLAEVAGRPFRPGRLDCAMFAAGAVEAMTGKDPAATWRGAYRTLAEGRAAIRAAGYSDHLGFVATHFAPVAPALAQVGDLAALPSDVPGERGALGVIQGPGVYALLPSGLAVVSRLHIERAFKV